MPNPLAKSSIIAHASQTEMPLPVILEPEHSVLSLESTLADLVLHRFAVEAQHSGIEVARIFDRFPLLPGVVITEKGRLLGMMSRQRLLEFLIHGQGMGMSLVKPLGTLYSYTRSNSLTLADNTPIIVAASMALRRSPQQQSEPILVRSPDNTYSLLDVHELNVAHWQIRGIETQVRYERTHLQIIQTERMASLGRLVDGVAHEILDPVGFIWGNLVHLSDYTNQIMELLRAYEANFQDIPSEIAELQTEIELDYIRGDLPQTIASITAGADRLKKLVTSLQNFCHIDDVYPKPADLHACLDSILLLLKSRLSSEIEIVRDYGHLPPVTCYAGQLTQVFMNILTNAIDALLNQAIRREVTQSLSNSRTVERPILEPRPQLVITTQVRTLPGDPETQSAATRWIFVRIADNGSGLPPEKQQQIRDSFSEEKRVAKETSLTVSYQIVTVKHSGKLLFRSPATSLLPAIESNTESGVDLNQEIATGGGTEFEIWLPLI